MRIITTIKLLSVACIMLYTVTAQAYARIHTHVHTHTMMIDSLNEFQRAIVARPLAAVLFYSDSDQRQNVTVQGLKDIGSSRFVSCMAIDIDKVPQLAKRYGVMPTPTFMLFKDGQPYQKNGQIIRETGYLLSNDMFGIINRYFGKFIQELEQQYRQYQLYHAQMRAYYGWPWAMREWDYWYWPREAYYFPTGDEFIFQRKRF